MRLQKFLAHAGVCSRRKAESYILDGKVQVNGVVVTELGTKIIPEKDRVIYNKKTIKLKQDASFVYIILNKPKGYVTSCAQDNSKIILDLIDIDTRIYPVGRLDKDSTGLVLLTNDGELHNRLSHPSFDHEKEYVVTTKHPIPNNALKQMADGIYIDKVKTRKAKVKRLNKSKFNIILKQGLNRQIRKMVGKTGNAVKALKRIRLSSIQLGQLEEGKWRHLSSQEISNLTQRRNSN